MKTLILILALLSSICLNAQTGKQTPNSNNNARPIQSHPISRLQTTQPHEVIHIKTTPIEVHRPVAPREKEYRAKWEDYFKVGYCMIGEPMHFRFFGDMPDAEAFMGALALNPNCITYFMDKIK